MRAPEISYNFVRRFVKSASKSDIFEVLNASTVDGPTGWTIDALNHMGFICQLDKSPLNEIYQSLLPAILKGRDGSSILLDQINEKKW